MLKINSVSDLQDLLKTATEHYLLRSSVSVEGLSAIRAYNAEIITAAKQLSGVQVEDHDYATIDVATTVISSEAM